MEQQLRTTQRNREIRMLGITKRDRKTSKWIREQTNILDIIKQVKIDTLPELRTTGGQRKQQNGDQ